VNLTNRVKPHIIKPVNVFNILRFCAALAVFTSLFAVSQDGVPQPGTPVSNIDRSVNRDVTEQPPPPPNGRLRSNSPASKWGPARNQPTLSPTTSPLNQIATDATGDQQKAAIPTDSGRRVTRVESQPKRMRPATSPTNYVPEETSPTALKHSTLTGISTTAGTQTFTSRNHSATDLEKKKKQKRPNDQSELAHRKQSPTGGLSMGVKPSHPHTKALRNREKRP
jgi:hypothetical protein